MSKDYLDGKEEHIADLVKQGFTSGHHPSWALNADRETLHDDSAIESISRLIRAGNIEGYHPRWFLSENF